MVINNVETKEKQKLPEIKKLIFSCVSLNIIIKEYDEFGVANQPSSFLNRHA